MKAFLSLLLIMLATAEAAKIKLRETEYDPLFYIEKK